MKGVSTIEFLIIISIILILASVILFVIKSQNYEGIEGEVNISAKEIKNISVIIKPGENNGKFNKNYIWSKYFVYFV